MIRLSVITTVLNGEHTIGKCVSSVAENLSPEIEYIVKDGLSSDGTCSIVRREAPSARLVSGKDSGIYDGMNAGIRLAQGEYVSCLNADDFYLPGTLEKILKIMREHPECDIIHGNIMVNGREKRPPAGLSSFHGSRIFHPAAFIRKTLLEKCNLFDTAFPICADLDFFLKAKELGAVFFHADLPVTDFAVGGVSTRERKRTIAEVRAVLKKHGFPFYFCQGTFLLAAFRAFLASLRVRKEQSGCSSTNRA